MNNTTGSLGFNNNHNNEHNNPMGMNRMMNNFTGVDADDNEKENSNHIVKN
jgi:hypothetical protein